LQSAAPEYKDLQSAPTSISMRPDAADFPDAADLQSAAPEYKDLQSEAPQPDEADLQSATPEYKDLQSEAPSNTINSRIQRY